MNLAPRKRYTAEFKTQAVELARRAFTPESNLATPSVGQIRHCILKNTVIHPFLRWLDYDCSTSTMKPRTK